jgi:hypothetical protein
MEQPIVSIIDSGKRYDFNDYVKTAVHTIKYYYNDDTDTVNELIDSYDNEHIADIVNIYTTDEIGCDINNDYGYVYQIDPSKPIMFVMMFEDIDCSNMCSDEQTTSTHKIIQRIICGLWFIIGRFVSYNSGNDMPFFPDDSTDINIAYRLVKNKMTIICTCPKIRTTTDDLMRFVQNELIAERCSKDVRPLIECIDTKIYSENRIPLPLCVYRHDRFPLNIYEPFCFDESFKHKSYTRQALLNHRLRAFDYQNIDQQIQMTEYVHRLSNSYLINHMKSMESSMISRLETELNERDALIERLIDKINMLEQRLNESVNV